MTTINERQIKCPYCNNYINIVEVTSFSVAEKESDFFPHYLGVNPLPILVETCPNCKFTDYTTNFEKTISDREREKISKVLKKMKYNPEISGAEKYRNLALCSIAREKSSIEIGDCYLKSAWCDRLDENSEDEIRALRKAVNYFEIGLKSNEISGTEELVVRYLAGEIYRRFDDMEKAKSYWQDLHNELTLIEKDDSWLTSLVEAGLRKLKD
ncbi:MAG: DUF2225 domain-containing protein [Planctomycetes bacterium]|nr:DUF2225 domain-containing protein [Planctomycetota bacterium]